MAPKEPIIIHVVNRIRKTFKSGSGGERKRNLPGLPNEFFEK